MITKKLGGLGSSPSFRIFCICLFITVSALSSEKV
nr:MAG TPA: hypothetical protein [Caudoviricetes sp.]